MRIFTTRCTRVLFATLLMMLITGTSAMVGAPAVFKVAAGADTMFWNDSSTWVVVSGTSITGVPGSTDQVILDHTYHGGSYLVSTGLNSAQSPAMWDTAAQITVGAIGDTVPVQLLIPHNAPTGTPYNLLFGDGLTGNYDFIIQGAGVVADCKDNYLRSVSYNSLNDSMWIRTGGLWYHNTKGFNTMHRVLSRRFDGDYGTIEFDVNGTTGGSFDIGGGGDYYYPNIVMSNTHGFSTYYWYGSGATYIKGNLTINPGAIDSMMLSTYPFMIYGDIINKGTTISTSSPVVFAGTSRQQIVHSNPMLLGGGFLSLNPYGVIFHTNVNVIGGTVQTTGNYTFDWTGTAAFITVPVVGVIDIDTSTMSLDPAGSLNEGTNAIQGRITTTRVAGTGDQAFGNIGFEMVSAAAAPGLTTVLRKTGIAQTGNGHQSIRRYYDVTPTINTGLGASINVSYDPSELNGIAEANLLLQKSNNGGVLWSSQIGSVNLPLHRINATGVQSVQDRWTAADLNAPLSITHTLVLEKLNDLDGNPVTKGDQALKQWRLSIYRDSVSPGTLINTANPISGHLSTTNIPSGLYIAVEEDSASWLHLGINEHGTSLVNQLKIDGSRYDTVSLTDAGSNSVDTIDFINHLNAFNPSNISGMKFADVDSNGVMDSSDSPIPGWTIYLKSGSTVSDSTRTDSTGHYTFSNVPVGHYSLSEENRPHYVRTFPTLPSYDIIIDGSGAPLTQMNFGNFIRITVDSLGSFLKPLIAQLQTAHGLTNTPAGLIVKYLVQGPKQPMSVTSGGNDGALPPGSVIRTLDSSTIYNIGGFKYLIWLDMTKGLKYGHPCMFVVLDKNTGLTDTIPIDSWPVIHGAYDPPNQWTQVFSSWDERVTSPDTISGYGGNAGPIIKPVQHPLNVRSIGASRSIASSSGVAAILIGGKANGTDFTLQQHDLDSVATALLTSVPPAVAAENLYIQNNATYDSVLSFLDHVRDKDTLYFYISAPGDSVANTLGVLLNKASYPNYEWLKYSDLAVLLHDTLHLERLYVLIDASYSGKAIKEFMKPSTPVVNIVTSTDPILWATDLMPADTQSRYTGNWRSTESMIPMYPSNTRNWNPLNDSIRTRYDYLKDHQRPMDSTNAAQCSITQDTLKFSDTPIRDESSRQLTITNIGWIDLRIDSISLSDTTFSLNGDDTALITRNDSRPFSFKFKPLRGGHYDASLQVFHNGDLSPTILPISATALSFTDSVTYRTFTQLDYSGLTVPHKPDKVAFVLNLINATGGNRDEVVVDFPFRVRIDSVTGNFTTFDSIGTAKKWSIKNGILGNLASVNIYGVGTKGKLFSKNITYTWKYLGVACSNKAPCKNGGFTPSYQTLLYPMPSAGTLRDTVMNYLKHNPNPKPGLYLGIFQANRDSSKHHGWIRLPSKMGAQKFFVQSGTPSGFHFHGEKTSYTFKTYQNPLAADLAALRLSIIASSQGWTQKGFGQLIYQDNTDNPLNGLLIQQIADRADSVLTYWERYDPSLLTILDTTILRIDTVFAGVVDTESFSTGLKFKGTKAPREVSFILAGPTNLPGATNGIVLNKQIPARFALYQSYPNPFNPSTTIRFDLPDPSVTTLKIYNILGQEVRTLIDHEIMDAGSQKVVFTASNLASGVYFYRLTAKTVTNGENDTPERTFISINKMILMK